MKKQIVHTEKAPQAIGPYSQGVKYNGFIYTSGQIPFNVEKMSWLRLVFKMKFIKS